MKSFISCGMLVGAALCLFVACGEKEPIEMTITAQLDARAGKAAWQSGERLNVFSLQHFKDLGSSTLSCSEAGVSVEFRSDDRIAAGDSYLFFYPVGKVETIVDGEMYVGVPTAQEAVPGGVDEGLVLLAGRAVPPIIQVVKMQNATAFVKVSLAEKLAEAASTMILESCGGEMISGDMIVSLQLGNISASSAESGYRRMEPSSVITMAGPFEPCKSYTFSVIPGKFSQLALTVVSKKGTRLTTEYPMAKDITLHPGDVLDLGILVSSYFDYD